MRVDRAIEKVEDSFGSVEDFAWTLLTDFPEVVKGDYNLQTISGRLKLPPDVVAKTLNSPAFRAVMSRLIVAREYSVFDEIKHVKTIKNDAISQSKNISTRIAAREHLARLEGRPLNRQEENVTVPIQINFGSLPGDVAGHPEITIEGQRYEGAKAGQLPPEGARRKYTEKHSDKPLVRGISRGDELDFYSDESPYSGEGAARGVKEDEDE